MLCLPFHVLPDGVTELVIHDIDPERSAALAARLAAGIEARG
jgi:hypothetical protein